jgi:aspartyl-tRNA(Asn)/glutamyl-tRNA(Gln) amidotransferase subunit A
VDDLSLLSGISAKHLKISTLKVAYCPDLGFKKNIDREILNAIEQVALRLSESGACISQMVDIVEDPVEIASNIFLIEMHRQWNMLDASQQQLTDCVFQDWAAQGSTFRQSQIQQLKLRQYKVKKQMQSFMKSYDIILCASTMVTADAFDTNVLATDIVVSYLFNLTHQPSVTVPVGINQHGMPMGVLIAGATGADAVVLEIAKIIKSMFPMPDCTVIL